MTPIDNRFSKCFFFSSFLRKFFQLRKILISRKTLIPYYFFFSWVKKGSALFLKRLLNLELSSKNIAKILSFLLPCSNILSNFDLEKRHPNIRRNSVVRVCNIPLTCEFSNRIVQARFFSRP